MRHKIFGKMSTVLPGLLLASMIFFAQSVRATTEEITLSCMPGIVSLTAEKSTTTQNFPMIPGESTLFTCNVTGLNDEVSATLLGKITESDGALSAVSQNVLLNKDTFDGIILTVPAMFQSGNYSFAFTLTDASGNILSEQVPLTGVIAHDNRASIGRVTLDKNEYEWQSPFNLTAYFDVPENTDFERDGLLLSVAVLDVSGNDCVVLNPNQVPVTETTQVFPFVFPERGECSNALRISLYGNNGTVLDQYILAVGLDEQTSVAAQGTIKDNMFFSVPTPLLVFLGITGVLFLVLSVYFLRRKRQ